MGPLLGIGSCLAGNAVRYNGESNDANDQVRAICETFETRVFCPEMAIGLGVPRQPIHLVGEEPNVRVLDVATHQHDHTQAIQSYALQVLTETPSLTAYILVKGSPSCGYGNVKRFSSEGELLATNHNGIFAAALAKADPLLPLEDDEGLTDPVKKQSFLERAALYYQWKILCMNGLTTEALTAFYVRWDKSNGTARKPDDEIIKRLLQNAPTAITNDFGNDFIAALMAAHRSRPS
ncbi:MAG: hypothetical protein ACI9JM_000779 [Halioglobus sp.]|jgi:uncharacterized protein YbbK (DUF523 family)